MIGGAIWLLVELAALFLGVSFLIQLFQRRFGAARLRAWMGGSPLTSALKGIAIGFITPFCTYSAIPMLVGLRQAGVPAAGYVAFIAAAPVLDPVLFGALVVIVGVQAAALYAAVAFAGTLTLALVAQRADIGRHLKPLPASLGAAVAVTTPAPDQPAFTHSSGTLPAESTTATEATPLVKAPGSSTSVGGCAESSDDDGCSVIDDRPWAGLRVEAGPAARSAINLLRSVGLLLLVGVGVGLLIEATVSPEMVATATGNNGRWSIPVAAALGTPLYVQTSIFVPIADSLRAAGVGVGAIVALTISGAGANIPEFIILSRLAARRLIAVFVAYVFAIALIGGLLAQALLG